MPEFFKHPIMKFGVYPLIALALIHRFNIGVVDPATYVSAAGGFEDFIAYPEDLLGGFSLPSMDSLPSLPGLSSTSGGSGALPLPPVSSGASQAAPQAAPVQSNNSGNNGACGDHGARAHAMGTYSNGSYTIAPGDTHYSVQNRFPCADVPSPRGMLIGRVILVK